MPSPGCSSVNLKRVSIVLLWPDRQLACLLYIFFFTLVFTGESTLDFLFDFVETSQGLVEAFAALETRPRSGNENCEDAEFVD